MSGKALLKAVSAGRPRQVRLLLDSGVPVDDVDDCRQTPLIRTIFIENDKTRLKILKMLLRRDALVSKADVVGRNALDWAALYGLDEDVRLLLDNADIDLNLNKVDINGQSALYHAVSSGNAATVKIIVDALIKYDLTVDIVDYEGFSPLMHAFRLGHDVCASILIHNGGAKIGLSEKESRDFTVARIWNEHQSSSSKHRNTSQFPPIISRTAKYKIKFRETLASYNRSSTSSVCSESDDECSSITDSDSYTSEDSIFDINEYTSTPVKQCLTRLPYCRIPPSVLAISPTTSTEAVISSDEECVSFSTPLTESVPLHKNLNKLYNVKQDQMSRSYRPNAKPDPHEMERELSISDSSSSTDKPDSSWTKLREDLLLTKNKRSIKDNTTNSKPTRASKWSVPKSGVLLTKKGKNKNNTKYETSRDTSVWSSQSYTANQRTSLPSLVEKSKEEDIFLKNNDNTNYSMI